MRKSICRIFSFIISISIVLSTVACSKESGIQKSKIKHRRQSWLNTINWDENRLDYTGKNIRIAIIDSGIDMEVKELSGKIKNEKNIADISNYNDKKHGTAVASIIAAESSSEKQVEGIAPDVSIVSIDVTNQEDGIVEVSDLAEGINEAISNGVDIINVSVGCTEDNENLKQAVENAINNNVIIIASAGNYTQDNILFPSKYDGVLSVGSLNKKGEILYPKEVTDKKVLYFPGEKIVAAIGNNKYSGCEGTSFSNAICTGLVALLLEKKNDKKAVKRYLEEIDYTNSLDFVKIIENYDL